MKAQQHHHHPHRSSPQTLERIPLPEAASLLYVSPTAAAAASSSPKPHYSHSHRAASSYSTGAAVGSSPPAAAAAAAADKRHNASSPSANFVGAHPTTTPTRRNLERDVVQEANFEQLVWARLEAMEEMLLQLGMQVKQLELQQQQQQPPVLVGRRSPSPSNQLQSTTQHHHWDGFHVQHATPSSTEADVDDAEGNQNNHYLHNTNMLGLSVSSNSLVSQATTAGVDPAPPSAQRQPPSLSSNTTAAAFSYSTSALQPSSQTHPREVTRADSPPYPNANEASPGWSSSPFAKKPIVRLLDDDDLRSSSKHNNSKKEDSSSKMLLDAFLPSYQPLLAEQHRSSQPSQSVLPQRPVGGEGVAAAEAPRTPTRKRPSRDVGSRGSWSVEQSLSPPSSLQAMSPTSYVQRSSGRSGSDDGKGSSSLSPTSPPSATQRDTALLRSSPPSSEGGPRVMSDDAKSHGRNNRTTNRHPAAAVDPALRNQEDERETKSEDGGDEGRPHRLKKYWNW